jgi:hypothetical protein
VSVWELVRMIATARIIMPTSMVRLSAGRLRLSHAEQALCFAAGANSIFSGEKLLTTSNNAVDSDAVMFETLGEVFCFFSPFFWGEIRMGGGVLIVMHHHPDLFYHFTSHQASSHGRRTLRHPRRRLLKHLFLRGMNSVFCVF